MNNLFSFFRALFLEENPNLSKKSRIITLAICAAVIVGAIVAMHINNMAYGETETPPTPIIEPGKTDGTQGAPVTPPTDTGEPIPEPTPAPTEEPQAEDDMLFGDEPVAGGAGTGAEDTPQTT
jgi:hypothetical protein